MAYAFSRNGWPVGTRPAAANRVRATVGTAKHAGGAEPRSLAGVILTIDGKM